MGFQQEETTYRLTFAEGTKLAGLVVTISEVPVGTILDLAELADGDPEMTPAKMAKVGAMFETLADAIVEWNFCDRDGQPVAPTLAGVRKLNVPNAMRLLREWFQVMTSVSDPLGEPSTGGSSQASTIPPQALSSIPMETVSTSRAS